MLRQNPEGRPLEPDYSDALARSLDSIRLLQVDGLLPAGVAGDDVYEHSRTDDDDDDNGNDDDGESSTSPRLECHCCSEGQQEDRSPARQLTPEDSCESCESSCACEDGG